MTEQKITLKESDKYIIEEYHDDETTVMLNGEDFPFLARFEIDMQSEVMINPEELHEHGVLTDDGMLAVLTKENYEKFKATSMRA